ncbi:MAG TPA: peptide MFS transporter, partial [Longimicrobiales bacterium]|nr:peptide MFS transporter [Longimicrobiales bacterium]
MAKDDSMFEQPQAGTVAGDEPPPSLEETSTTGFFGHPKGLSTLFFTEMWERFSYYGLRPLLVLFMAAALAEGGFGFDRDQASAIVGIYGFCVYLASLPGGWVADRWLGLRRAIWWGAALISLGHISIGLSAFMNGKVTFFLGLILIVLGTGLLKPNISAIVGDLYPEGGARRDAGFSIFYVGINLGAFFGQLITGFLGEQVGWHYGFGAAGVGMLIGLTVFTLRSKKTLGNIGLEPSRDPDPARQAKQERIIKGVLGGGLGILAVVVVLAATGAITIDPQAIGTTLRDVTLVAVALFFLSVFFTGGLTTDEKKRVGVIVVLFLFAMVFWSAFEQAPTSLNLFAADFTDRQLGGFEIPATWFQSVNAFFIILLAPVFAAVWVGLSRRGIDLSSPSKFAFGLAMAGVGFV